MRAGLWHKAEIHINILSTQRLPFMAKVCMSKDASPREQMFNPSSFPALLLGGVCKDVHFDILHTFAFSKYLVIESLEHILPSFLSSW